MPVAVWMDLAAYACATTTISPGPNNILLLSNASRAGIRACRSLLLGIWCGLVTVLLLCGFGCAWVGQLLPRIVPVARYAGAGYILYLAFLTLRRKTGSAEGAGTVPLTMRNGFLLQFLNVKILMLGITAYSGYILPYGFHVGRVVLFALVMTLCAAAGNLLWATMGTLLLPVYRRYNTPINVAMAGLLVWCAWKILVL